MLIDFGNAPGRGGSNKDFGAIAEDILRETNGHLDVVVMTHEHLDHMEGFHHQRKIFNACRVDHVWMSLPSSPTYYQRYPNAEPVKKLGQQVDALGPRLVRSRALAPSFETLLRNNISNSARIDYVRSLAGEARVRYLARGAKHGRVKGRPFERARVTILAPEPDASVYYGGKAHGIAGHARALGAAAGAAGSNPWKFADVRRIPKPANLSDSHWRRLRETIRTGTVDAVRTLDCARNNTSLVFMLEVAGKRLLFTGDAELESWDVMNQKARQLLKPVDFIKISHHGSHNGTPKGAILDRILKRSRRPSCLVSTKSKVYGTKNPVPDAALLAELGSRCKAVHSTDGIRDLWLTLQV